MKATITIEVPNEFLEQRARESWLEDQPETGHDYFTMRVRDVIEDELPSSFWGWPLTVTLESVSPE